MDTDKNISLIDILTKSYESNFSCYLINAQYLG